MSEPYTIISLTNATSSSQHNTTKTRKRRKKKRKRESVRFDGSKKKKRKIGKIKHKTISNTLQNPICIDSSSDSDIQIISDPNMKELKISNDIIYKSTDRILFIGEMDFSLSLSISNSLGAYYFVCTAYYDILSIPKHFNKDANYIEVAKDNINSLKANGASVMFGVDGTKLDKYCFELTWGSKRKIKLFDKIVFGYPYCCSAHKESKRAANQMFMANIFKSCKNLLKNGGELHVILVCKQINLWKISYDDWKMTKMKKLPRVSDIFPGYTPRDTKGRSWDPEPSALFVFQPKC